MGSCASEVSANDNDAADATSCVDSAPRKSCVLDVSHSLKTQPCLFGTLLCQRMGTVMP